MNLLRSIALRPRLASRYMAVLICCLAVGGLVIFIFNSTSSVLAADISPVEAKSNPSRSSRGYPCVECGVVNSIKEIESPQGSGTGNYAISVRLRNGSTQLLSGSQFGKWHNGERVIIIGGVGQ